MHKQSKQRQTLAQMAARRPGSIQLPSKQASSSGCVEPVLGSRNSAFLQRMTGSGLWFSPEFARSCNIVSLQTDVSHMCGVACVALPLLCQPSYICKCNYAIYHTD
jgi:hypothetical protein